MYDPITLDAMMTRCSAVHFLSRVRRNFTFFRAEVIPTQVIYRLVVPTLHSALSPPRLLADVHTPVVDTSHLASDKARYVNKRAFFWTWKALSALPSMSNSAGSKPSGARRTSIT